MQQTPDRWRRRWLLHAKWGMIACAVLYLAQPFAGLRALGGIGYLLAFAALVVVPLGASLVAMPRHDSTAPDGGTPSRSEANETTWLYRLAARSHPLAAGAAVAGLLQQPGDTAAWVAGLWLLQALLLAGFGAYRLTRHGLSRLDQLTIDVGLLQLPIGAAWWLATCAGWRFGFSDLIVQMTAVHFHYAGFAAPLICGLAGRGVDPAGRRLRGLYRAACCTAMLAVWIVAAGLLISVSGIAESTISRLPVWLTAPIELAGTVLLATGMLLLAGLLCLHLPRRAGMPAGALLAVAGLSLALPMVLAVAYANGRLYGWPLLTISEMARWHGFLNAFGFAGVGLTAFALWRPSCRQAADPTRNPTRRSDAASTP